MSEIIFSMKLRRRVPDYTTPDYRRGKARLSQKRGQIGGPKPKYSDVFKGFRQNGDLPPPVVRCCIIRYSTSQFHRKYYFGHARRKNYRSKITKFQNFKKIQNSQEISKLSKNSKFSKTKFEKF
jgi:hypothetical protein